MPLEIHENLFKHRSNNPNLRRLLNAPRRALFGLLKWPDVKSYRACLARAIKIFLSLFIYSKNNQLQNILILYHINNFFLLFK
jgi:hypothetical protein